MTRLQFSLAKKDPEMWDLVLKTDKKVLAKWAIDCAKRVLPYFEEKYPLDKRPQTALKTLDQWIKTGEFHMAVIRKASLDSHRAAKDIGNNSPAASVAHACGQAVATAHVPRHAYGSAIYAQQAIFRTNESSDATEENNQERNWQYHHLMELSQAFP